MKNSNRGINEGGKKRIIRRIDVFSPISRTIKIIVLCIQPRVFQWSPSLDSGTLQVDSVRQKLGETSTSRVLWLNSNRVIDSGFQKTIWGTKMIPSSLFQTACTEPRHSPMKEVGVIHATKAAISGKQTIKGRSRILNTKEETGSDQRFNGFACHRTWRESINSSQSQDLDSLMMSDLITKTV